MGLQLDNHDGWEIVITFDKALSNFNPHFGWATKIDDKTYRVRTKQSW